MWRTKFVEYVRPLELRMKVPRKRSLTAFDWILVLRSLYVYGNRDMAVQPCNPWAVHIVEYVLYAAWHF